MPRARNIKPGFFESEDPARVSLGARILWIAMWTLADRDGWLEERPVMFRKYAFGYDPFTVDQVAEWLGELVTTELVVRHEIGGSMFLEIPNFGRHQKPHPKEPPSGIKFMHDANAVEKSGSPVMHKASAGFRYDPAGKLHGSPPMHEALAVEKSGNTPMHGPIAGKLHGSPVMHGPSAALIVDSGMLNVDSGERNGALALAPPPQPAFPEFGDEPDPTSELNALAIEIVGKLPAGGSVSMTKAALQYKWHASGDDIGTFCAFVRSQAEAWRKAWDENPDIRRNAAQFWIGDGDYKAKAPQRALVAQAGQKRQPYEATKPQRQVDVCKRCAGTGSVMLVDFARAMSMDRADDALGPCPECRK